MSKLRIEALRQLAANRVVVKSTAGRDVGRPDQRSLSSGGRAVCMGNSRPQRSDGETIVSATVASNSEAELT